MPEDVEPKERIPALLNEWGAVAKEARKAIEEELKALGFKGDPAKPGEEAGEAGGVLETAEPEELEMVVPPKRRGRPPASSR